MIHIGMKSPGTAQIKLMLEGATKASRVETNSAPDQNYLKLTETTEHLLKAHYAPHDAKLWNILGVAPWW